MAAAAAAAVAAAAGCLRLLPQSNAAAAAAMRIHYRCSHVYYAGFTIAAATFSRTHSLLARMRGNRRRQPHCSEMVAIVQRLPRQRRRAAVLTASAT